MRKLSLLLYTDCLLWSNKRVSHFEVFLVSFSFFMTQKYRSTFFFFLRKEIRDLFVFQTFSFMSITLSYHFFSSVFTLSIFVKNHKIKFYFFPSTKYYLFIHITIFFFLKYIDFESLKKKIYLYINADRQFLFLGLFI